MTGMPMVPPGALGAGAEGANKDKPVEKRVTAPGCAEWSTGQGPLNSTAECSGDPGHWPLHHRRRDGSLVKSRNDDKVKGIVALCRPSRHD